MAFELKIEKVLISDNLDNCCQEILSKNGIEVKSVSKLTKEELLAEIPNFDALIVRSATKVTKEVLEAGNKLKLIGRAGTGVDNIDINSATSHGIIVMNTPSGNTLSAAEQSCAMIISLARNIPQAAASMREGKWDRKKFMGNELFEKTLGIVGLGRIGLEVAKRMQSFGMKTIGFDPLVSAERAAEFDIEWMELEQLWPQVDYITVHTPLIPQTKGLLNDKTFGMCKKGVRVVNCARGGIIDEECLLKALETGQCAGAGLDVFVSEPPTGISEKVVQHPRVISCPHLGASTVEAQKRVARDIAEQIIRATKGESLFGAINASSLQDTLKPETGAWIDLCTSLAKTAVSFCGDEIIKVIITTYGPKFESGTSYIGPAVLKGIISKAELSLNLINAEYFAKELGVQVEKLHENNPCFSCNNAISIVVQFKDKSTLSVTGTVFGSNVPTLVEMNGHVFVSPLPLFGKLCFIHSNSSDVLAKIFENGKKMKINALCSSVDCGMTVLNIEEEKDDLYKLFAATDISFISF